MNVFDQFPYLNQMISPTDFECLKTEVINGECLYNQQTYEDLIVRIDALLTNTTLPLLPDDEYVTYTYYLSVAKSLLKMKICMYESMPCLLDNEVTSIISSVDALEKLSIVII